MFCDKCEALGETCCEASKARQQTAVILANIVDRQTAMIKVLTAERDRAREGLRELLALHAVKP